MKLSNKKNFVIVQKIELFDSYQVTIDVYETSLASFDEYIVTVKVYLDDITSFSNKRCIMLINGGLYQVA